MRRALLLLITLATASPALAGIRAEAPADASAVLLFHDTKGPCLGDALLVEYVSKDGEKIPGCYTSQGSAHMCVFLDGDIAIVPLAALRAPKKV